MTLVKTVRGQLGRRLCGEVAAACTTGGQQRSLAPAAPKRQRRPHSWATPRGPAGTEPPTGLPQSSHTKHNGSGTRRYGPKAAEADLPGWVLGLWLDGSGGCRHLENWAPLHEQQASGWCWVHLDARCPSSRVWLERHGGTRSGVWTTSRLLEDDSTLQPRVDHSDTCDALLMTLQASLSAGSAGDTAPFYSPSLRLWMCDRSRLVISTTSSTKLLVMLDLPALAASGRPRDLGDVATLLADQVTKVNVASWRAAESSLFHVKSELQKAALSAGGAVPVPWNQLTALRGQAVPRYYECIMQRRYATPQRDALEELERFVSSPQGQPLFSERTRYALREVILRQGRLVSSLDALCSASDVLSDQLMTHVGWHGARNSQRLAYLAAFIGLLGSASVAIEVTQAVLAA